MALPTLLQYTLSHDLSPHFRSGQTEHERLHFGRKKMIAYFRKRRSLVMEFMLCKTNQKILEKAKKQKEAPRFEFTDLLKQHSF